MRTPTALLKIDIACALSGGLLYFILFDFIIQQLKLPFWLVSTQLIANYTYGFVGIFILLSKKTDQWFPVLIALNFLYASFCIGIFVKLFLGHNGLGPFLLLLEGLMIAALATWERNTFMNFKKQTGSLNS